MKVIFELELSISTVTNIGEIVFLVTSLVSVSILLYQIYDKRAIEVDFSD